MSEGTAGRRSKSSTSKIPSTSPSRELPSLEASAAASGAGGQDASAAASGGAGSGGQQASAAASGAGSGAGSGEVHGATAAFDMAFEVAPVLTHTEPCQWWQGTVDEEHKSISVGRIQQILQDMDLAGPAPWVSPDVVIGFRNQLAAAKTAIERLDNMLCVAHMHSGQSQVSRDAVFALLAKTMPEFRVLPNKNNFC